MHKIHRDQLEIPDCKLNPPPQPSPDPAATPSSATKKLFKLVVALIYAMEFLLFVCFSLVFFPLSAFSISDMMAHHFEIKKSIISEAPTISFILSSSVTLSVLPRTTIKAANADFKPQFKKKNKQDLIKVCNKLGFTLHYSANISFTAVIDKPKK